MSLGFYGKMPSEGDFVARRLSWAFTEPWDAWMQSGLRALREARPEHWLDGYLSAPLWRFRIGPGLAGPQAWCGLWFPSVDRVGRHFPLCLAQPLAPEAAAAAAAGLASADTDAAWQALEDRALLALDPRMTVGQLDALAQTWTLPSSPTAPPPGPDAAPSPSGLWRMHGDGDALACAQAACAQAAQCGCVFFTWGGELQPPTLIALDRWPEGEAFAVLAGQPAPPVSHLPG